MVVSDAGKELKRMGTLRDKFEHWLGNYENHKYTPATISRYIRALEKAEAWFGVKLDSPILNITDVSVLRQINKQIRGANCSSYFCYFLEYFTSSLSCGSPCASTARQHP